MNTQLATIDTVCIEDKVNCILSTLRKVLIKSQLFQSKSQPFQWKNLNGEEQKLFNTGVFTKLWLETYFSNWEIDTLYEQIQRYNAVKFLSGTQSFQNIFFIDEFDKDLGEIIFNNLLKNLSSGDQCIDFLMHTQKYVFDVLNTQLQKIKDGKNSQELWATLQSAYIKPPEHFTKLEQIHKVLEIDFVEKLRNKWMSLSGLSENTNLTRNRFSVNKSHITWNIEHINKQIWAIKQAIRQFIEYVNSKVWDKEIQKRILEESNFSQRWFSQEWLAEYFKPIQHWDSFRIDVGIGEDGTPTIFEIDDFPRWNIHYILHDLWIKWKSSFLKFIRKTTKSDYVLVFIRDGVSEQNKYDHEQLTKLLQIKWIKTICLFEKDFHLLDITDSSIMVWDKKVWLVIQAGDTSKWYFEIAWKMKSSWVPITPSYSHMRSKSRYGILSDDYKANKLDEKYIPLVQQSILPQTYVLGSEGLSTYTDFDGNKFTNLSQLLIRNKEKVMIKYIWEGNAEWVIIPSSLSVPQLARAIEQVENDLASGKKWICIQKYKKDMEFSDIVYHSKAQNIQSFKGKVLSRLYIVYQKNAIKIVGWEHMLTTWSKWHGMVDMAIYPLSDNIIS